MPGVPEANRTVTLKVKIKPNNDRSEANLEYSVETRFPCDAPGADIVQIAKTRRRGYVPVPQMSLDDMIDEDGDVVNLETGEVKS